MAASLSDRDIQLILVLNANERRNMKKLQDLLKLKVEIPTLGSLGPFSLIQPCIEGQEMSAGKYHNMSAYSDEVIKKQGKNNCDKNREVSVSSGEE